MSKESLPDQKTIDAYHYYVQSEIRSDLNSISLGSGRLPALFAKVLAFFAVVFLLIGILIVALRMRHVYLWDWEDQFVGPFFFILFLFCCGGATYFVLVATRRSNRFRRELYFHPLGDYGIAAVHKDDIVHQHDMKQDLKSGTNPHKVVKPSSEAYSAMKFKNGHSNEGYNKGPGDPHRSRDRRDDRERRDDRGRDDRDRRRGPLPEGGRRPPDDRDRRRPPDARYGPAEGRRGPPPQGDYRRGPPKDERAKGPDDRPRRADERPRGPDDRPRGPDDRPRGPDDRPRGPDDRPREPDERPRGPPRFPDDKRDDRQDEKRGSPPERRTHFRERSPDDGLTKIKLDDNKQSESEL